MKTLVIDVGGTNVKVAATGRRVPIKIPSGPSLTPRRMVSLVKKATADWSYDRVSIGYPGPVTHGRPAREPRNLGRGWVNFDYRKALGRPVRIINDAAMQALGSYEGGRMLFLGLGTGLGTTLIADGAIVPMEIAHLPYRKGKSYEELLGEAAMLDRGKADWARDVAEVCALFHDAFVVDYIVLGGGNAKRLKELPPNTRLGDNANAIKGGFRLWTDRSAAKL